MKVSFEKSRWSDAVVLSLAIRWEDWHLREIYLDLDFIRWCYRLIIKL